MYIHYSYIISVLFCVIYYNSIYNRLTIIFDRVAIHMVQNFVCFGFYSRNALQKMQYR